MLGPPVDAHLTRGHSGPVTEHHPAPGDVLTVTPNPSLDRTTEVDRLVRGQVLRSTAARLDPGGKGLNVSRALLLHGVPTRAVLPVGGPEGDQLLSLAERAGISLVPVPVGGATRTNVAVVESDGTVTKLNDPGPAVSPDEVEALLAELSRALVGASARWLVASGSLPPGAPVDLYARMVRLGHKAHVRVAVDSSGGALGAALVASPDLLAPNRAELAEVTASPVATIADVVQACRWVQQRGAVTVLASLSSDGAVLVEGPAPPLYGESPAVRVRSAVGAGDALLAGFVAAGGSGGQALLEGLAWGAAAAALPGSVMPGPEEVRRTKALGIRVGPVDERASVRVLTD